MPLDGDEFKGSDDRSGNHLLEGNFLDNEILAIFKNAGSDNENIKYFKADFPTDVLLREKLDELEEKEKYISSLNKDIDKLSQQKIN